MRTILWDRREMDIRVKGVISRDHDSKGNGSEVLSRDFNDVLALSLDSPDYPENLRAIPDPPPVLFVRGRTSPQDRVAVAIVGTRKPTPLGRKIAFEIARDLASSHVTIVSGLAYGIDAEAHKGALEAGGRTIACLGAGVDVIYPSSNAWLFKEIPQRGCLVSEYPPGTEPHPWYFPARNRLISGLSLGVLVVEAGEKSGALITADWALKQGRPVMAVPGSPKSSPSQGTNRLIQEGAYLVTSALDVLSFLKRENEYIPEIRQSLKSEELTLEEAFILETIREEVCTLDGILEKTKSIPIQKVLSLLTSMEVKGAIYRLPGGRYAPKTQEPGSPKKGG